MTTIAADKFDLPRWALCGAVVLCVHAAAVAMLLRWHEPVGFGEPSFAIVVDLSPYETPPSDSIEDIAPGPRQQEAEAPPPQEKREQVEAKVEQKIETAPEPDVAVPPPEQATPTPPQAQPAPATTAPPPTHASQAAIRKWYTDVRAQFDRHKAYPKSARLHHETGTVQLAFAIDRAGRVVSSAVEHSSGYATLDQEAIATVRRAEPFPAPPAAMPGDTFNFTLPVPFSMR
jgi:periplasmic protein TonB